MRCSVLIIRSWNVYVEKEKKCVHFWQLFSGDRPENRHFWWIVLETGVKRRSSIAIRIMHIYFHEVKLCKSRFKNDHQNYVPIKMSLYSDGKETKWWRKMENVRNRMWRVTTKILHLLLYSDVPAESKKCLVENKLYKCENEIL